MTIRGPLLAILFLLGGAGYLSARINLVTLPERQSVQLTIYNSVDLTLVRETRSLTFRKGLNRLEFSWANTLIDPTSLEFRAVTHTDEVEVLDVSFPPRVANTLEWRVQSEFAGEVQVEIRYFTSGIRWSADYVALAARNEQQMDLSGYVRIDNQSGEDYSNAEVRLVVGVIRLVEEIAQLARLDDQDKDQPRPTTVLLKSKVEDAKKLYALGGRAMSESRVNRRSEIIKEGLSEYFLYTVDQRDDIPNGWGRRIPSFAGQAVPVESLYKFEQEQWGLAAMRFYRFTNSLASKLGREPLPDGAVKAFRSISSDQLLALVGRTSVKYIPVNDQVDLALGADAEVEIKPTLVNWEKVDLRFDAAGNVRGWTVRETWKMEMQNSKEIPVKVDARRNFTGDWSMESNQAYEKVDAGKVKFLVSLQPRESKSFSYTTTTRHGINAAR